MFREILHGRFLGHPIHAMLVHFPVGLFTAGACFDVIAIWTKSAQLPVVSFYCIAGGLITGSAAMLFGLVDYISLANDERLFRKAGRHALLQLTAWLIFAGVFGLKFSGYPDLPVPDPGILIPETAAVLLMFIGNFIGGELVYKDGIGTSPGKSE